jgi:chorismate--pyruvate lyase
MRPVTVPQGIWSWLADPGSLTRRVTSRCAGRFRVRVLRQGWGHPCASERRALGLPGRASALLREVELLCDGIPWVYARTVIPAQSLRGAARRLALLGDKPLGAVLFADPATTRDWVEIARLLPLHPLFHAAARDLGDARPAALWGRRTLFRFAGQPLLVNEIFLPTVPV